MPARVTQPALPLDWPARLGEAEYFISDANREASAWLADPARWPMPRTVLTGPPASGKTHLARLFDGRHAHASVIEDADRALVAGSLTAEALFHAWNAATDASPLLITARALPPAWPHALPDLASRLAATPLVRLAEPDDALLGQVLAKQLGDRGLAVPGEVIAYIAARIERRFSAVAEAATALDALSLAERRAITVPLARRVLEEQLDLGLG